MIDRAIPSSRPIQAMGTAQEPKLSRSWCHERDAAEPTSLGGPPRARKLCSQQHGLTSLSPSTTGAQPDRR